MNIKGWKMRSVGKNKRVMEIRICCPRGYRYNSFQIYVFLESGWSELFETITKVKGDSLTLLNDRLKRDFTNQSLAVREKVNERRSLPLSVEVFKMPEESRGSLSVCSRCGHVGPTGR